MRSSGYEAALITFGIILGLTGAAAGLAMRMPGPDDFLPPSPIAHRQARHRNLPAANAEVADLLADVRDDDDDVYRRPLLAFRQWPNKDRPATGHELG
jgi:hypothetical protein